MVNGRTVEEEILRVKAILDGTTKEQFEKNLKECGFKEGKIYSPKAYALQNKIKSVA
ncbi:hypothetical protein [Velocimicrobium porci]|uniref:hypothetical protein n=1 Tax=Velocimicrobium porci TaxID=2606634 RepID=UPI0012B1F79A|nr:hypothetical protein [Velocimicrobium porci]